MNIQQINLIEIKPYWRNSRDNKKTVEALKKSIKEYGYINPIVIDKNYVIIAGHARFQALKALKFKTIECIIVDMPDDKAKEYRIADNKIQELTTWDIPDLKMELKEIGNNEVMNLFFDFDLSIYDKETNFSASKEMNKKLDEEYVEKAQEKLDNKFTEISKERNSEEKMREVICPFCLEQFNLKITH